jgi:chromosome segregation ATPase
MMPTAGRRAVLTLLIGASALAGFGAIRVAAAWTASAAPLEASPVAADVLRARLIDETSRSAAIEDRLAAITAHARELESALATAQVGLDADAHHAQELTAQLAAAKKKLAALERSIQQARAPGRTVMVTTTSTSTDRGHAEPESEGDDD